MGVDCTVMMCAGFFVTRESEYRWYQSNLVVGLWTGFQAPAPSKFSIRGGLQLPAVTSNACWWWSIYSRKQPVHLCASHGLARGVHSHETKLVSLHHLSLMACFSLLRDCLSYTASVNSWLHSIRCSFLSYLISRLHLRERIPSSLAITFLIRKTPQYLPSSPESRHNGADSQRDSLWASTHYRQRYHFDHCCKRHLFCGSMFRDLVEIGLSAYKTTSVRSRWLLGDASNGKSRRMMRTSSAWP